MASSEKYDVFLNFRGETRNNFTKHLYDALNEVKVKTYIDNLLEKGDEIAPALTKAIEDSSISVVIFSENYASSMWCLDELRKIMECKKEKGQIVIPVFYNTDPSQVRKQTGGYKQAFTKHEGEPRCNEWKAALTEAANLAGWDTRNRPDSKLLIMDIVGDILRKLATKYSNQREVLVGIKENYDKIESLLKIGSSEVRTLGIWGMGGIGKTTLATAIYDKLSPEFEGCCFLANVREESFKLEALRKELLSKLLENKNHDFDHFDINRLRRKKVFIVLDDVATRWQLEYLIKNDFLGAGSRVIVTTRNKQILSLVDEIYKVEELSSLHSLQLFCLTVFGEKQPKDGYEHLSSRVVSYCKGIPLAIKLQGASLRSRSKEVWEYELIKLQKIPNMEIHSVLKLSYDDLDHSEKEIFLDIACFFKGWHRDYVTSLLEACDFFLGYGIQVLLDSTLITISDDNKIEMDDLTQEMGREIVHQECIKYPGKRSRLWKHEEVCDVLKYNKGTHSVEGISLDLGELTCDLYLSYDSFAKMTYIRFLRIHNWYNGRRFKVHFPNGLEFLPHKLKYLEWDGFCLEYLPSNFCAERLVELCMRRSKLKKLWEGVQYLFNLKKIDLSWSRGLIEILDLSTAKRLESISLRHCESLRQLHPSMLSLPRLTYLDLNSCRHIESLNGHSKSVSEHDLDGCALSSSIGHLLSLEELDICGTNVESLPANIKNLSMLRMLRLDYCTKLMSLPELSPSLEKVSALNCISLETDITQQLVLRHMLHSRIPKIHGHPPYYGNEYFIFPGDHVIDKCGFHTAESSITIPSLSKSHLWGFIYCIILSKGLDFKGSVWCSVYQCDTRVGWLESFFEYQNLISDHVVFLYHDVNNFNRASEEHDHFRNIKFIFENCEQSIKECGVLPVYASE